MTTTQRIVRVRRRYNQWVANQTLEDFALRFTAEKARRWSAFRVANTALGSISFLALEAIGGALTLSFGFANAVAAILTVSVLIFLTGVPISAHAARAGVDIDLLSRGAGFGYIGSTITSLIYASFTFIFFALEAAIMATALELLLGIPIAIGYLLSALAVIPLVTHGITLISRFQLWTQPLWIGLHILPFAYLALHDQGEFAAWLDFPGVHGDHAGFSWLAFGAASSVVFALSAQIGEQADFLRFLPRRRPGFDAAWWTSLLSAGPGWIILGCLKMLAGSYLAYLALRHGVPAAQAADPSHMYLHAFGQVFSTPAVAMTLTGVFIVVSQLKINVTNAYAGSIAWSNFFSRLTHNHPGRVVWLIFNVAIAWVLMQMGIYRALEEILGLYAIVAVAWVGALTADLMVNKPLGLSPPHIEFKRAHLYDVNPVGVGAMLLAIVIALLAYAGLFGQPLQALHSYVALGVALVAAPLIALATGGRYYIARPPAPCPQDAPPATCCICEHPFEAADMAHCPAYGGAICSLCCSLDARCHDSCKQDARFPDQILLFLRQLLPPFWVERINTRLGHYLGLMFLVGAVVSAVLGLIYLQAGLDTSLPQEAVAGLLFQVFVIFMMLYGVAAWLFVLANESRRGAQEESNRQTTLLLQEIQAHEVTDRELQRAMESAETANLAKSRYVVGLAHEFRTPLNTIFGYAQLLEDDTAIPERRRNAISTMKRSAEHLSELINGLLDIAQIEAGKLRIQRNDFVIAEFLDGLVDMFRLQCTAKRIDFHFERPEQLPPLVCADEKRLRQALINLLNNAVKFTEQGFVRLAFRYRVQVAEFIVEDSGVGIAAVDQDRVFLPFERVTTPELQAAKGTGLGLAITKLLAEVLGGELKLTSAPGQGCRFVLKVFLPTAHHSTPTPAREPRIRGYLGDRQTLMVVDDETAHRELIEELLTPLGFIVRSAPNAAACLQALDIVQPDAFLLDISMPGMTGWALADELRARGHRTAPIVMVSADATELQGERLSPPAHDAYLIKPIELRSLLDTLADLLKLTWAYQTADAETTDGALPAVDPVSASTVPAPTLGEPLPAGVRASLRELVELGHIRGLERQLDTLLGAHPASQDHILALREAVQAFDLPRVTQMLEGAAHAG